MSARPEFLPRSFRHRHNLWLGKASELARPILRVAAAITSRKADKDPRSWRRGLIIGHNHMGDVLYRTSSLPKLKAALPACEWSFLTAPGASDVLRNNPFIPDVLPLQHGENAWSISSSDFRNLRARNFDVALCSNSLRYYPDLILATALGIPNRVSFVHKGMSGLVTHPVAIEFPSPYAAYFRTIVAAITGEIPSWSLRPQVFPDESARHDALAVLGQTGLDAGLPVVACVLTTRQAKGNWPAQFLLDVLAEARETLPFGVAFCGAKSDDSRLREITSTYRHEKAIIAGDLEIPGFAALLERCAALVTLDSGPRHLANAVNIPVIFARNMSHSQIEAGSYCDSEIDIAPAGEYLSDEQIRDAAARCSPSESASALVEILSREPQA